MSISVWFLNQLRAKKDGEVELTFDERGHRVHDAPGIAVCLLQHRKMTGRSHG